jgi:dipeptidyl aminopeptidase/acylaminoacyl peptidase
MKSAKKTSLLLCLTALAVFAAEPYRKPPKAVLDVMNAPLAPTLVLSPTHNFAVQAQAVRYPPIAELAEPMHRIAGLRINPKTNGLHNTVFSSSLLLRKIPEGTEIAVQTPPNARLSNPRWNAAGTQFAFTNTTTANGIELWIGDTTGKTHKVEGVRLNGVLAGGFGGGGGRGGAGGVSSEAQWMPDGKTLLVELVKPNRGAAPALAAVPTGPAVQESLGGGAPAPTLEDMLQNPHDEELFVYYATSQLATVDPASGKVTPLGKPAIIQSVRVSPNGKDLLVTTIHKPFSYLHSYNSFPKEIEVWDLTGRMLHKIASLPLEDKVPMNGVLTGPRNVLWRPGEGATLMWVEALDGGDLKNQVPNRDRLLALTAPFTGEPREVFKTEQRFGGIQFFAKGGTALVSDTERKTRIVRSFEINLDDNPEPRLIWSRNQQDRYRDPGTPITKMMPNGENAILQDGDDIFLSGLGSSPSGDHPFLNRYNRATKQTTKLFQCDDDHFETVVGLLDDHASKFLTHRESPTEPPNYYMRTPSGSMTAVTKFPDPQPSIR